MKKLSLTIAALATASCAAFAASSLPNALYVVKDGTYQKFNFGVAGDLVFSNEGKTLSISGYNQQIDLDKVDYITFEAPMGSSLTASQQKDRLVQIGDKLNSMIDLNKHSDLITMCYRFFNCVEEGDIHHHAPGYFEVPEEYWNLEKETKKIAKAVQSFAKGNPAAVRALAPTAINLHKMEDYFGIYVANEKKEIWEKIAEADYFEIQFPSADKESYSIRISKNGSSTKYTSSDFNFEMPEKIDIKFTHGATTLASATVATSAVQDKSIDMTVNCEANGYVVKSILNILNEGIKNNTKVWIDNTLIANADADVVGKNLLDYESMKSDAKEATHYHDEDDNCCGEDPEQLIAHFVKATAEADILGELQIKGLAYDPMKVYSALKEEDDDDNNYFEGAVNINGNYAWPKGKVLKANSDKSIIDIVDNYSDEEEWLEKAKNHFNNFSDVAFYYDMKPEMQGFLGFDTYDDVYEYEPWEGNHYAIVNDYLFYVNQNDKGYYISTYTADDDWSPIYLDEKDVFSPTVINEHWYELTPILYFPDMTSFYFEDFFDEGSFSKLINDYEDIIDTYLSITGQDEEEDY